MLHLEPPLNSLTRYTSIMSTATAKTPPAYGKLGGTYTQLDLESLGCADAVEVMGFIVDPVTEKEFLITGQFHREVLARQRCRNLFKGRNTTPTA